MSDDKSMGMGILMIYFLLNKNLVNKAAKQMRIVKQCEEEYSVMYLKVPHHAKLNLKILK